MAIIDLPPDHIEQVQERYVLSADLGQAADYTAVAVMNHRIIRHMNVQGWVKQVAEFFDVVHLERLVLNTSYVDQVAYISKLLSRPPLNNNCGFVIDSSGVGRPVGDLFRSAGVRPTSVTITAGENQSCVGDDHWHVNKSLLVSTLDARLHLRELRFAAALSDAPAMADELRDFRRSVSASGRHTWAARGTAKDDLVLSVALGLWMCVGRPKPPIAAFGTYSQFAPSTKFNAN